MKKRYAARVALGYAVVAALWILFSDYLLLALGFDAGANAVLSILKGLMFVTVTAGVLYGLAARYAHGIEASAQTLLTSERRYRDLIQSVRDIVWETDAEHAFTFVSDRAKEILGFPPAELVGKTPMDLAPPGDAERLLAGLDEIRSGTVANGLLLSRALREDGEVVMLESNVLPLFDDHGSYSGARGVTRDVTERERLTREAREAADLVSLIIRVSPVPIIALDDDGRVTMWNPAAEKTFGWDADEVVGRSNPIVPEDDMHVYEDILERSRSGEHVVAPELVRRTKNGDEVRVRLSTASIAGADGVRMGTMAVLLDITEESRIQAELIRYREHLEELVDERTEELRRVNLELKEATDAKSAFLASMSHELRTPLNAIIGFTGVLASGLAGPLNEEQVRQLRMTNEAGKHLLDLVNDVLNLSKIEAGRIDLVLSAVRVSELVERVSATASGLAAAKGLAWDVRIEDPETELLTDARKVEQVLLNLLGNAVKFTEFGGVTLRVFAIDGRVRFEVSDTGRGIPEGNHESVFEEFVQVRDDATSLVEGTGLGLSIARRLATLLGGTLTLVSTQGEGSTFTLQLPITLTCTSASLPHKAMPVVLVVDDDPEFVARVEYALRPSGYRVMWARSVSEVFAMMREQRPGVALVKDDDVVPGGGSLAERLATDNGGAPIVVITVGDSGAGAAIDRTADAGAIVSAVHAAGVSTDTGVEETS